MQRVASHARDLQVICIFSERSARDAVWRKKRFRTGATPKIRVIYRSPTELKPDPKNPNRHSTRQLQQLIKSVNSFGFVAPILIDKDLNVVAGHARQAAAKMAGLAQVPTITLDHLSPLQARAYMIADNKLAQAATWDNDLLREQLEISPRLSWISTSTQLASRFREIEFLIGSDDGPDEPEHETEPEILRSFVGTYFPCRGHLEVGTPSGPLRERPRVTR